MLNVFLDTHILDTFWIHRGREEVFLTFFYNPISPGPPSLYLVTSVQIQVKKKQFYYMYLPR